MVEMTGFEQADVPALFAAQLQSTADLFTWAALAIPDERRYVRPARPTEEWSAARHVFHMGIYEREVALPSMRLWLGGPPVEDSLFLHEDDLWASEGQAISYDDLLASFREVRAEQIALLPQLRAVWGETRRTVWYIEGLPPITPQWVIGKTLQHTAEHAGELLRFVLFWDFSEYAAAAASNQGAMSTEE